MKIALSTDHAGFALLKDLQVYLESLGHQCEYFGPANFNSHDDFPDFIKPAARAVAAGQCERGIIMGGSGQGEAMVANRYRGVRCAVYYGPAVPKRPIDARGRTSTDSFSIVRLSRQHNDANMLSLAARFVDAAQIQAVVKTWLETDFSSDRDYKRRIAAMDED